ncbi:uncharacterized protein E0L32_004877 [Thyridium curvatum]|uniref:Uncharacterized protein n=1 Tax=Thyridium curvatum TaxID=1093900 RepID=A0A507B5K8_9PEZI|nr:uncharacterized protein E0L32_004877 [Thyridium curvatum]TPX15047.1 hypothetical protein E0L32_004877 [Thyridium curvatum]
MPSRISSRRNSPVPEFDPYGYSPFDAAGERYSAKSDVLPPYRKASHNPDGHDRHGRRESPRHAASRSRSAATRSHRLVREEEDPWETDYDPRDKYYLSGDEDDDDGEKIRSSARKDRRRKTRDGERDLDRRHKPARDHHHHEAKRGTGRHESGAAAPAAGGSGSSRPHTTRRPTYRRHGASSYLGSSASTSRRPKPRPAHSYSGSSRRYPPSSSRSVKRGSGGLAGLSAENGGQFPWSTAARCAIQAGAIAALKVQNEPGSWIGPKGGRVATAALGAAVVDTYLGHKHPKTKGGVRHAAIRQVAEAAIGNMMVKPGASKVATKRGR